MKERTGVSLGSRPITINSHPRAFHSVPHRQVIVRWVNNDRLIDGYMDRLSNKREALKFT